MERRNFLKVSGAFALLGASAKRLLSSSPVPSGDKPPKLAGTATANRPWVHRASTVKSDYSVRLDDDLIMADGPCTLKLPRPATAGKIVYVRAQKGNVMVGAGGGYWEVKVDHASAFVSNGQTWFQM